LCNKLQREDMTEDSKTGTHENKWGIECGNYVTELYDIGQTNH